MTIDVRPLDGPLGAEIVGLDSRRPLTDGDFRTIERALLDNVAVVISDLEENVDWLVDLGRRFGPLVSHVLDQYHHPKTADISVIAANTGGPESSSTFRPAGAYWHSDMSYMAEPSYAILLYSQEIPSSGPAAKMTYEIGPKDEYPSIYTGYLQVTLDDGQVIEARQTYSRGGSKQPLDGGEIFAKMRANLVYGGWSETRSGQVADFSAALFDGPDVRGLAAFAE